MTKTNLITGFLGSGKTTSILHLLANKDPAEKWAVLVNEFGEVGIDGALLANSGALLKEIPGGCMCCVNGLPISIRCCVRENLTVCSLNPLASATLNRFWIYSPHRFTNRGSICVRPSVFLTRGCYWMKKASPMTISATSWPPQISLLPTKPTVPRRKAKTPCKAGGNTMEVIAS